MVPAVQVEPTLAGATQRTPDSGGSYFSLGCGADLTVTSASYRDSGTAPELSRATLHYAVWTEKEIDLANTDFFASQNDSGRHLRVSSVTCDSGDTSRPYVIHAHPYNATTSQEQVVLTASAAQVRTHLALLYLNNASSIDVPVAIAAGSEGVTSLSGVNYDEQAQRARFARRSGVGDTEETAEYLTQLTVVVPRTHHIEVVRDDGTVVSSVTRDDSTTTNTIQTLDVIAHVADRSTGLSVRAVPTTTSTIYMPQVGKPSGGASYSTYTRVRRLSTKKSETAAWVTQNHACEQPWDGAKPDVAPQTPSTWGDYLAQKNNCGGWDYNWYKDFDQPWTDGFSQSDSTTWTKAAEATNTQDSSPAGLVGSVGYGGSINWYVDSLPPKPTEAVSYGGNGMIADKSFPNAFLANVRVNDQDLFVPFPQPCMVPGDPTSNLGFEWCGQDTWYWSNGSPYKKRQYGCVRAWMMGLTSRTDQEHYCGLAGSNDQTTATLDGKRRLMVDRTFTTGAIAGMRVRVWLVNVRHGSDRLALRNLSIGYEDTSTGVYPEHKTGENEYMYPNAKATAYWRSRYEIQVDHVRTPEVKVEAKFDWNTHNRLFLANGQGVVASPGMTSTSIQVFGHLNQDEEGGEEPPGTPSRWITVCEPSATDASCSYMWQENTEDDPMKARAQAVNGYGTPHLRSAYDEEVTGAYVLSDDSMHFLLPKQSGRTDPTKGFVKYANSVYPLSVWAEPLDFTVRYYDADGTHLGQAAGFPDALTVDVARRYSFGVPVIVPDTGTRAFNSWTLEGWKGGEKVGTIRTGINPGDRVDIRDLTFLDGTMSDGTSLAGRNALTDGGGTPRVDELRMVPDTSTTVVGTGAGIYPVLRTVRGTAHEKEPVFYYRSVAGLHASLAPTFVAREDVQTYTEAVADDAPAGTQPRTFPLLAKDSALGPLALTASTDEPALHLVYGPPTTPVRLTKTLRNDTGWTQGQPAPEAFALRLTSVDDSTVAYTVTHGNEAAVNVAPGTYAVAEVPASGQEASLTQLWRPDSAGVSCRAATAAAATDGADGAEGGGEASSSSGAAGTEGTEGTASAASPATARELVTDGRLTVPDDGQAITCEVTNETAAVSVLAYDADSGELLTSPDYRFDLVPAREGDYTATGLQASASSEQSTRLVTPGASYHLRMTDKPLTTVTRLQRWAGGTYPGDAEAAAARTWEDVGADGVLAAANERTVLRVVVQRYQPVLPLTGGWGSDLYLTLGAATFVAGALAGAAVRRRRH